MSDFIAFLVSTGGALLVIGAVAVWVVGRPGSRVARRLLLWTAAAYLLASIYAVPYSISRMLVIGYSALTPADLPHGRVAIVVLSGGISFVENWDGGAWPVMDAASAARVWEAYRLYRLTADAWVVSSEGAR